LIGIEWNSNDNKFAKAAASRFEPPLAFSPIWPMRLKRVFGLLELLTNTSCPAWAASLAIPPTDPSLSAADVVALYNSNTTSIRRQ
jgi:hypothetical protein